MSGGRPVSPRDVAGRFFLEVWNERRLGVLYEIIAPDCVTHQLRSNEGAAPGEPRGPAEIEREVAEWHRAFPDLQVTVEDMVAEGDRVVSRVALRGTHAHDWMGVPARGKAMQFWLIVTHRVRDGFIIEDWVLWDRLGLLQQLGVVADTVSLLAAAARE